MTDPFPELPRRVLYMDKKPAAKPIAPIPFFHVEVAVKKPSRVGDDLVEAFEEMSAIVRGASKAVESYDVTKVPVTKIKPVTKIAGVTKTRGRPAKRDKPMTAAERMRLYRAKKTAQ